MFRNTSNSLAASRGQGERDLAKTSTFSYDVIKIAMDVDLQNIVFVRQLDIHSAVLVGLWIDILWLWRGPPPALSNPSTTMVAFFRCYSR